jgi:hypothetical protein
MKTPIMSDSKPETMGGKIVDRQADTLGSQINISIFLGLLILTVFVMPAIGFGSKNERWYGNIVFSILIGAGTAIAWRRRRLFFFSALIGFLTLSVRWLALWVPGGSWGLSSELAALIAVLMISWILLSQIFRSTGPTTAVSLQAAIAVYLLFGLAWANAYLIVIQLNPASFQSTVSLSSSSATEWYYYSYVTLTTLGYGEITPLTRIARVLAAGEAVTGQLYLAVLIARLIGMELMSSQQKLAREHK